LYNIYIISLLIHIYCFIFFILGLIIFFHTLLFYYQYTLYIIYIHNIFIYTHTNSFSYIYSYTQHIYSFSFLYLCIRTQKFFPSFICIHTHIHLFKIIYIYFHFSYLFNTGEFKRHNVTATYAKQTLVRKGKKKETESKKEGTTEEDVIEVPMSPRLFPDKATSTPVHANIYVVPHLKTNTFHDLRLSYSSSVCKIL